MKKNETLLTADLSVLFVEVVSELKAIKEELKHQKRLDNKRLDCFEMDYTPSPISRSPIITQNEAFEEMMLRNGMMSRETWEALAGVQYDAIGENIEDDSFLEVQDQEDGEFEQSRFASYYERKAPEKIEVPNIETKKVDTAPAPASEPEEVKND